MIQNSKSKTTQSEIEDVMKTIHNESYSEWIKNFAINLPNIWNEYSAHNRLDDVVAQGSRSDWLRDLCRLLQVVVSSNCLARHQYRPHGELCGIFDLFNGG